MKILISDVIVAERQRTKVTDLEDLCASMARIGQINAIVVQSSGTSWLLIAGERRLEAAKLLGWEEIEASDFSLLSTEERELVELDENIRRSELPWKDKAIAILKYHERLGGTIDATSSAIGLSDHAVHENVLVGRALRDNNKSIETATGLRAASNILDRHIDRAIAAEAENIADLVLDEPDLFQPSISSSTPSISPPRIDTASRDIVQADFLEFAQSYSGRPFNLFHCDFPYGINHDKSEQGKADSWGAYQDTPEHYKALCEALIINKEKLLTKSAHVVFWFSMNYYEFTKGFFEAGGFQVNPFPLIWLKSDNKGILPDPERGPRRIYETALLMSLGDRKIVKAVSNAYACPSSKELHLSEKPVAMLQHFLSMLTDEYTELLDPTCGSANALVATERLKAKRVNGLEINPEYCEIARSNLRQSRVKSIIGG